MHGVGSGVGFARVGNAVKRADFVLVWKSWDDKPSNQRDTNELVRWQTGLGMPYGMPGHHVHDVLTAWRRCGLTYEQSYDAYVAGARTLMP